jgi:hypothetical protein
MAGPLELILFLCTICCSEKHNTNTNSHVHAFYLSCVQNFLFLPTITSCLLILQGCNLHISAVGSGADKTECACWLERYTSQPNAGWHFGPKVICFNDHPVTVFLMQNGKSGSYSWRSSLRRLFCSMYSNSTPAPSGAPQLDGINPPSHGVFWTRLLHLLKTRTRGEFSCHQCASLTSSLVLHCSLFLHCVFFRDLMDVVSMQLCTYWPRQYLSREYNSMTL